jgi:uncharacterized protein
MRKIFDAWPILAWLQDEQPAADEVQRMLDDAENGMLQLSISMINVGEVYYRLARSVNEDEAKAFLKDLKSMPVKTLSIPKKLVIKAAQLKSCYAISYADAFAVATAISEHAPLVSGDPELRTLEQTGVVTIEWLTRTTRK